MSDTPISATAFDLPKEAQTGTPPGYLSPHDLVVIRRKGEPVPPEFSAYDIRHAEHYRASTKMAWDSKTGIVECPQCGKGISLTKFDKARVARAYANGSEFSSTGISIYLVVID